MGRANAGCLRWTPARGACGASVLYQTQLFGQHGCRCFHACMGCLACCTIWQVLAASMAIPPSGVDRQNPHAPCQSACPCHIDTARQSGPLDSSAAPAALPGITSILVQAHIGWAWVPHLAGLQTSLFASLHGGYGPACRIA